MTKSPLKEIFFDVETLRLSNEVPGGWSKICDFGLSVAVTWDAANSFRTWLEPQAMELVGELARHERIVSFNGNRFDFEVLGAYAPVETLRRNSFDVLQDLHSRLGYRVKLDAVARETLGVQKTGDGTDAVKWWREGKRQRVILYCEQDVRILRDLVEHGRKQGHVIVDSRKVRVEWGGV